MRKMRKTIYAANVAKDAKDDKGHALLCPYLWDDSLLYTNLVWVMIVGEIPYRIYPSN